MSANSKDTDLCLWLAGESGEGIVSLGDLVSRGCTKLGLPVFTYRTFPAEIRGGTVLYKIRIREHEHPVSPGMGVDILVVLNQEGYDRHKIDLGGRGIIIYDSDGVKASELPGVTQLPVPFTTIANEEIGFRLAKNIAAFGAVWTAIGGPSEIGEEMVRNQFRKKGEEIVDTNLRAFQAGKGRVTDFRGLNIEPLPAGKHTDAQFVNGNEAVSLAAIAAGLDLFAGYPITPASEIMEQLASELPEFGGKVVQAEDEIAALAMCIGASFAGCKAMTATSGPGLSLMVEQINLCGMAEVPVVIVDVQRGGPSTGMPTKTSQGDLNLAAFGVHNESPRVVLAPINVEDCFYSTLRAISIAEHYQLPVIVLSEQALSAQRATTPHFDPSRVPVWERLVRTSNGDSVFLRYEDTPSGISPMALPGTPGFEHTATGLEHDEAGHPAYSPEMTTKMTAKRFRKMEDFMENHMDEMVHYFGDTGEVDIGILAWGSTVGPILEILPAVAERGIKVGVMAPLVLLPLPVKQIQQFAGRAKKLICIEMNYSGQLARVVRSDCGVDPRSFTRDNGMPLEPMTALEYILAAHEGV